jgi:hypothetical protein
MDMWRGAGRPPSAPAIEEYTFIFLSTDKYSGIYSSALYSLVPSSVNRGIYVYSLVMKVCSLGITDECGCVSYSNDSE